LLLAIDEANDFGLFDQPFPVELREISNDNSPATEFEILPDLRARVFSSKHTKESLAIRLTHRSGASLVYSSDTGYDEGLAAFARGVDLLLMECSFWRDKPTAKHLELAEAMRLARLAEPRKAILTHLYLEWDGIDLESKAKELWPGETIGAYDGLRIEVQNK
jgi:ribonuclease BN (tRNA processing enzyme)